MSDRAEAIPVFGRDFEQLLSYLYEASGEISPERFARVYNFAPLSLANAACVSLGELLHAPNVEAIQRFLRESLQITCAAAEIAPTVARALFWFKNSPIPAMNYQTGHALASTDRTGDVLGYISSLQAGFSG